MFGSLPVFRALILAYLDREKLRSSLTFLGVALGVAVTVAMALANEATIANFRATVEQVAGRTDLEIAPNGPWLREEAFAAAIQTRGVRHAVPRLMLSAEVEESRVDGKRGEVIRVLGIDIVNDAFFRDYQIVPDGVENNGAANENDFSSGEETDESFPQLLNIVQNPRSILLTESLAGRLGLGIGDNLHLLYGDDRVPVSIAALIDDTREDRVVSQITAVMDMAAAQDRFGLRGKLSAVDCILEPTANLDKVAAELRGALAGDVIVRRPENRGETVEKMLAAFRYNLTALAYIALMVGMFLIYNTVSVSVVRRREEIGTLRALGARRRHILMAFLGEGAFFGVAGALAGVILGYFLAQVLLKFMNLAVGFHWLAATADYAAFDWPLALGSGAIGLLLSLLAAFLPAFEASTVPPANTMRAGSFEGGRATWVWPMACGGAVVLALGYLAASQPAVGGLPIFGFAAAFLCIIGFACLAPLCVLLVCKLAAVPYQGIFKAEGILAVSSVDGSRGRATVAITGLMVGLAMVISLGIMVGSFRQTVVSWLQQSIRADLYIAPTSMGQQGVAKLQRENVDRLEALAGVENAIGYLTYRFEYDGFPANLGVTEFKAGADHEVVSFTDGSDAAATLQRAIDNDMLLISEPFAYRNGVTKGDAIKLPTPSGLRAFEIAGIYRDYTSDLGFVVMDWGTYDRFFAAPNSAGDEDVDSFTLFLEEGANADAVRTAIMEEIQFRTPVTIETSGSLRRQAIRIFDGTFSITYVLMAIAMLISMLGIATTLLAMVIDRRRELVTLRFLGMARGAVAKVIMLESALLALGGILLGAICGWFLSFVLIYVINKQSFGWTIEFSPPYLQLGLATLALFICATAAGYFPAREAGRIDLRYR